MTACGHARCVMARYRVRLPANAGVFSPHSEVVMSQPIARLALVLVGLALAACTSPTTPGGSDCGVQGGTGQCVNR